MKNIKMGLSDMTDAWGNSESFLSTAVWNIKAWYRLPQWAVTSILWLYLQG